MFLKATDLVRGQLAVVVWAHYLWLAFGNRAHKEFRKSDTGLKPKGHPACHPATNPHVPPVCGFGAQTARWRRLNAMAFEFRLKKCISHISSIAAGSATRSLPTLDHHHAPLAVCKASQNCTQGRVGAHLQGCRLGCKIVQMRWCRVAPCGASLHPSPHTL